MFDVAFGCVDVREIDIHVIATLVHSLFDVVIKKPNFANRLCGTVKAEIVVKVVFVSYFDVGHAIARLPCSAFAVCLADGR